MAGGALRGFLAEGSTALEGATMGLNRQLAESVADATVTNAGMRGAASEFMSWAGGAGLGSALASFTNADSPGSASPVTSLPTKIIAPAAAK